MSNKIIGSININNGMIFCLIFACFFLILALVFTLLKEKGAMLISGFNTLPKIEREKYNKQQMSINMRNSLFVWSIVFVLGASLSFLYSQFFAIIAFIVWLVLFFKDVHFYTEKAFGKYRNDRRI